MSDPRVERFAHLLVHHCISIRHSDRVLILGGNVAEPLVLQLAEAVLRAGGHPHLLVYPDRFLEIYVRCAQDHQLSFTPTFELLALQQFEAGISIGSGVNTRQLSRLDPHKERLFNAASGPINKALFDREAKGEFKRVTTLFPTQAYAQDARMSAGEFEDMFYAACHVNEPQDDPIAFWGAMARDNEARIAALAGHEMVHLRSKDCDIKFSIEGRKFVSASGKVNMPDGEVFTGPVEDSATGWIRFTYPSIFQGIEVAGVELVFKDGTVTEARAKAGESTLKERMAADKGASRLGEFGIGTNYGIADPSGMILLDEKMGGSIHLAMGLGYPETGSNNNSAIHWDLVTDFRKEAEIVMDGDIVYKDGGFVI